MTAKEKKGKRRGKIETEREGDGLMDRPTDRRRCIHPVSLPASRKCTCVREKGERETPLALRARANVITLMG